MKRALLLCALLILTSALLIAQEIQVPQTGQELLEEERADPLGGQAEQMIEEQVNRLQLAVSNENYPVTPGDIYRLSFSAAGTPVSNQVIVESDYSINLGIFGEIDARNTNFPELKKRIERLILEGYPRSLPSLSMISIGTFQVPVVGEIPRTRYVTAWGLSRLSEIVNDVVGRHSSLRDVRVISRNGTWREFDLWMANYKGDLTQNPYVRPGDRVEISRVEKEIRINGEVYRPGRYQLQSGESLQDVEFFSGGFTPLADLNRITVERYSGEEAELIVLDYEEYNTTFEFEDRDIVTVPSKRSEDLQVTVVGAVFNPGRYEYTPPEKFMYYVNQAGGIDFERNSDNEVTIVDRYGNNRSPELPVMPGDTVTVLNNDFVYNFNRYFPVVTTGFAFILTIIEIVNLANQ